MQNISPKRVLILFFIILTYTLSLSSQDLKRMQDLAVAKLVRWNNPLTSLTHIGKVKIDSVGVIGKDRKVTVYFSPTLSYYPFREENASLLTESVKNSLGRRFRKYRVEILTNGFSPEELVPNLYRTTIPVDSSRIIGKKNPVKQLVRRLDTAEPQKGLSGRSIALWHSHGYFFEMSLDRWEWQRAKLFGTVEDISVMGYVQPYLSKMLENSGANVFMPRERDTQINEVIVDNDRSSIGSEFIIKGGTDQRTGKGFRMQDTLFTGTNPFHQGTSIELLSGSASYIPYIPESGDYAVYISFPANAGNSTSVKYSVNHSGGKTSFLINQTIGGSTWIYLGTFRFREGKDILSGSVVVENAGEKEKYTGLDAVRFGGGMGNVARRPSDELVSNQKSVSTGSALSDKSALSGKTDFSWKLSGKPRYLEAARYYLQYAGMPDSLVYSPNFNKNDYNDDYMSRGLWVNYLTSPVAGTAEKDSGKGLGIPIDLSVAFHSDAGITPNDSVIGTLAIYSTGADNGKFPGGKSRMASRDLSDIIQTQVIEDIRKLYDPEWTRRGLWDKPYSEAKRPNVPAILLELLSHQNLADQKFGLDPRFRFSISRAVYKGILKYIAYSENMEYVVQPLPVTDFAISRIGEKRIRLSWLPVADSLEPTAVPLKYRIYKRLNDNGFDNGVISDKPNAEFELENYDTIYSFKVTALNEGGESFDSEILSAGLKKGDNVGVLVVNGFDRISGPAWFDRDNMAGVAWWNDRGVSDRFDLNAVGDQYDFDRKSPWLDDDAPGWGASYSDMEGKIIRGNSFDFTIVHGKAIMDAGHSFFSVSDEYFSSDAIKPGQYKIADIILGEEKSTPFFGDTTRIDFSIYTDGFMKKVREFTSSGTSIIMTGAYVGSDLLTPGDSTALKFASGILHFKPRTSHAVKTGKAYTTDYVSSSFKGIYNFNTSYNSSIYSVEAPDAIEPADKSALCALRYSENNTSAGVVYDGLYKTFILGFPFETIISEEERRNLMKDIIEFFSK
jgi:hypothetical protein